VVDFVLGPGAISAIPDLMARAARGERPVDTRRNESYDEVWPIERQERLRAYVTVMEGCNKSCSFCVVPFTRGPEVNRSPEAIADEIRRALAGGAREVQLLGQNVNAYQHGELDFAALLAQVDQIAGVGRIRFATSHPRELTDRVIDAMADCAHVCNYLHLPVQSGSNAVLKRMYRGYDRERYLTRVTRLRRRRPDMALSTDVIVGFPGETEDEFADTLRLLDEVDFDQVFAFVYSPRPFTAAAQLPDPAPRAEKEERLQRLFARQDEISLRRNRALEGRVVEVLVEGRSPRDAATQTGRTTDNRIVHFAAARDLTGELVQVRLLRAHPHSISGELPV
jgi:tRNA-2-methylthio-N6-dimethylallyladenosine synthase